jgi:hypothetical protein
MDDSSFSSSHLDFDQMRVIFSGVVVIVTAVATFVAMLNLRPKDFEKRFVALRSAKRGAPLGAWTRRRPNSRRIPLFERGWQ